MPRAAPTVVILTLLILLGHALGSIFSLYEGIFWFDMAMHTLGGAWLAAVFVAVRWFPYRTAFHLVGLVLLAGLAWEIYEYGFAAWATAEFGNLGFHQPWTDTVSDLILDALGAAAVALFLFRKEREVA
jgi:hypothetical protein